MMKNQMTLSGIDLRAVALASIVAIGWSGESRAQLGVPPEPRQAQVDSPTPSGTAVDVQRAVGDPSPNRIDSNINEYTFQDEQINLDPGDGDVRVLRTDQKALMNDFVVEVFQLKNANPRELRNFLRTIIGLEGGQVDAIKDAATKENFLQVTAPSHMMPHMAKVIAALDQKWLEERVNGSESTYYEARNRRAADVDVIARLYASENGFSTFDTTANAVTRVDEPVRIKKYLDAAEIVDIPANSVLLEVTMYEVARNDDEKIGLDYINWKNGPGRNLWRFVFQDGDAQSDNDVFTSIFDPFRDPGDLADAVGEVTLHTEYDEVYAAVNYLLTSNFLDFLRVNGKARVITRETQVVKSANTATFSAEDQIVALVSRPGDADEVSPDTVPGVGPVIVTTRQVEGQEDPVAVSVQDFSRRLNNRPAGSIGVFVSFTPFVGLESMELVISASYADLNGQAPNGQPIINSRNVQTTVRLLDGEPYVISGLKRLHNIEEEAGAPWLMDIPGLGYLFGGETKIDRANDILIVVRPTFILPSQEDTIKPVEIDRIEKIVKGEQPIPKAPEAQIGYDQWLMGKNFIRPIAVAP